MKILTTFILILLSFSSHVSARQLDDGKEFYFIYSNAEYMKLNKSNKLYPWDIEELEKNKSSTEDIFVSQNCGFFEVELTGFTLGELKNNFLKTYNEPLNALIAGGEFCNISNLISIQPKLLKVKIWNKKLYVIDYWEVNYYGDGSENLVIYENWIIQDIGVSHLYKDLDLDKASKACMFLESMTQRELELKKMHEPFIVQKGNDVCFTKGVFIRDLPNL